VLGFLFCAVGLSGSSCTSVDFDEVKGVLSDKW
jgi:hypothetical protein